MALQRHPVAFSPGAQDVGQTGQRFIRDIVGSHPHGHLEAARVAGRGAVKADAAILEKQHAVDHGQQVQGGRAGDEHGGAGVPMRTQQPVRLLARFIVKVRKGLIKQHQVGAALQNGRQPDTLRLAARELPHRLVQGRKETVGQVDAIRSAASESLEQLHHLASRR